jgi:hypothetical protein
MPRSKVTAALGQVVQRKGWSRGAASLALLGVLVLARRELSSPWYAPEPYMPALWLDQRLEDGVAVFAWCYSEAGPILAGPATGRSQSWPARWDQCMSIFLAVAVVSALGGFIEGSVGRHGGPSAGLGLALVVATVALVRNEKRRSGT